MVKLYVNWVSVSVNRDANIFWDLVCSTISSNVDIRNTNTDPNPYTDSKPYFKFLPHTVS